MRRLKKINSTRASVTVLFDWRNIMTVIEHDFGKEKRDLVRRFTTSLSLDALHEANIQANPLPYLERASERIYQMQKALLEALQAATQPVPDDPAALETIAINAVEYKNLLNCKAIIERALSDLGVIEDI